MPPRDVSQLVGGTSHQSTTLNLTLSISQHTRTAVVAHEDAPVCSAPWAATTQLTRLLSRMTSGPLPRRAPLFPDALVKRLFFRHRVSAAAHAADGPCSLLVQPKGPGMMSARVSGDAVYVCRNPRLVVVLGLALASSTKMWQRRPLTCRCSTPCSITGNQRASGPRREQLCIARAVALHPVRHTRPHNSMKRSSASRFLTCSVLHVPQGERM